MNETNDPNTNEAFNTNTSPDTQTNPFTGDLKGEFSSDFGTNTNAVSQIFKSSSFGGDSRTKYIAIGAMVLLGLAAAAYFLTEPSADPFEDEFADQLAEEGLPADAEEPLAEEDGEAGDEGGEVVEEEGMEEPMTGGEEEVAENMETAPAMESTGDFTLVSPPNGARRPYDETMAPAEFTWEGPGDRINFSRSSSMRPLIKSVPLNGATFYALENPYPGTWYWQVTNASGGSEVRMFRVTAPIRRNFPVAQPAEGGAIAAEGGVVSWQAGEKIARYAVELVSAGASFAQPQHRFGTSGTNVAIQGVQPGSYDIRVGAFSEVSGRWEWQYVRNVTVQ